MAKLPDEPIRIILSRKGFDSSYGGHPSLIVDKDEMISLPIPDDTDDREYSEIKTKYGNLDELIKKVYPRFNKSKCHLDPDINYDALSKRDDGWKGCFGQIDAAQGVLNNTHVKKGDIFLFFGWFAHVDSKTWEVKESNGKHVIFGYMEVGEVIHPDETTIKKYPYLKDHPHVKNKNRINNKTNTIYIAADKFSYDDEQKLPGYGVFKYHDDLALTKEGKSRRYWEIIKELRGKQITYHSDKSWDEDEECFKSACRGQEFVITSKDDDLSATEWAINFIINHLKNRSKK